LLKEQNSQLLQTIDEQSVKLAALEEDLRKTRDSNVDNEVRNLLGTSCFGVIAVLI